MKKRGILILVGLVAVLAFAFTKRDAAESYDLMVRPETGPFVATVTTTGELQAKSSVKIYGPSNARKARIYEMSLLELVAEGTVVEKGDFVAELDRSDLNSKIKDADVELQKARSLFTQTRLDTSLTLSKAREERINLRYSMEEAKLRKDESIYEPPSVRRSAEIDYEKAQRAYDRSLVNYNTQVEQAIAKMQEVEAELTKEQRGREELVTLSEGFTINAPENGMVIYKRDWGGQKLTAGGKVSAWDPVVATLPDLSVMESRTYVNEVDIQKVRVGQRVEIGLDADPEKQLHGEVTEIANIGEQRPNSDAKVFEVKIVLAESDSTLRPAMTTSNVITTAEIENALFIPLETVHAEDLIRFVYVREGGRTVKREVKLGLMNDNQVVVDAGLTTDHEIFLSTPDGALDAEIERLPQADAGKPKQNETTSTEPSAPGSTS